MRLIEGVLKDVPEAGKIPVSELNGLLRLLTGSENLSSQQQLVEWLKHEV